MASLDDAHRAELDRTLGDLADLHLVATEWAGIAAALDAVDRAVDDAAGNDADGDGDGTDGNAAVDHLAQLVFEAKIQQRFRGGRAASTLPPTKKVSVLPWVGGICGALLLAVGGALGGGYVLAGVALLSLGVFAVAFAGSRVAHRNAVVSDDGDDDPVVSIPDAVAARARSLTTG